MACLSLYACSNALLPIGPVVDPVEIDLTNRTTYLVERELSREDVNNLTLVITIESISIGFDYGITFNLRYTVVPNSNGGDSASIMMTFGPHLTIWLRDDKGVLHDSVLRTGVLNQTVSTVSEAVEGHTSITFPPVSMPCTAITYQDDYSESSMTFPVKEGALPRLGLPVITPFGGDILASTLITMSAPTAGASIAYTLDGVDPVVRDGVIVKGTLYSSGFVLPSGTTQVRAVTFMSPRPTSQVRLLTFIVSKQIVRLAGGSGFPEATGDGEPANTVFSDPHGLALDPEGNVCFSDRRRNTVRKIDRATGLISTIAGKQNTVLPIPRFSGDGGPALEAEISYPEDIAFNAVGDLFIADSGNHRIRVVDHVTGILSTWAGGGFSTADAVSALNADLGTVCDLAFDASGDLYFVSTGDHRVRRIARDGERLVSTVAGTGGQGFSGDGAAATLALFNNPVSIAFDAAGNLYVSDQGNHRIRRISKADGKISTIAGTGFARYWGDGGQAVSADLNVPFGIEFDAAGSLYISDSLNCRIRKIDMTTGIITTAAGNVDPARPSTGRPLSNSPVYYPIDVAIRPSGELIMALNYEVASVR